MRIRNPRADARHQKSRLISSLVAIAAFALLAAIAFDKGLRAAAVFAVLLALGTIAFAIMSWGRWADARRALREATPAAPDGDHGPSVAHEGQLLPVPDDGQPEELSIDADLDVLGREELVEEVVKLRNAIRAHRDSTGHDLCWHHPAMWALLPEPSKVSLVVPEWPVFLRGCIRYRQSLDSQLPDAPRSPDELPE